jgi:hypothetical protein
MDEGESVDVENGERYTEVTHQSYFERLGNSVKGMAFGLLLVMGAIALLVWNEGNAVAEHRALDEGNDVVVSLPTISTVDPSYQGKLVHLVGSVETQDKLQDDLFGVTPSNYVLKMQRSVEMYQWVEHSQTQTKKNTGGSTTTTTTYTYNLEWKSDLINSNSFMEKSSNRQNPTSFRYQRASFTADPITLGAFTLSDAAINRMNWFTKYTEPLSVKNITDGGLRNATKVTSDNGFYIGKNALAPAVGDMRVSYQVVNSVTVSVVAQQVGDGFLSAYPTNAGRSILLLERGAFSSDAMFEEAHDDTTTLAWVLRFVGFLMMYIGFLMIVQPLSTLADVLPFLGNLVGGTLACMLFPVALSFSLIIIALAWIAYRPVVAICILLGVGGVSFGYYYYFVRPQQGETELKDEGKGEESALDDLDIQVEEESALEDLDIQVEEES